MKQVEFTIPLMSMARILSYLYKKLPSVSVNSVILFKITGNYLKVLKSTLGLRDCRVSYKNRHKCRRIDL